MTGLTLRLGAAAVATGSPYTSVAYLTSPGRVAASNTGPYTTLPKIGETDIIEFKFRPASNGNQCFFGWQKSGVGQCMINPNGTKRYLALGISQSYAFTDWDYDTDVKYKIDFGFAETYLNDVINDHNFVYDSMFTNGESAYAPDWGTTYLPAKGHYAYCGKGRYYYFKQWARVNEGTILKLDLQPVKRNADGVYGWLDSVSGTFYASNSAVAWGGPEA